MRKYLIFNINKEIVILSKNNPYTIYKALEQIYKLKKTDISVGINIYEQLVSKISNKCLNEEIYKYYKDNDYYTKINNKHNFYNKYRPEHTKMIVNNFYLVVESDSIYPSFFNYLNKKQNLFACDFENRDYFWLDELILKNNKLVN